MAFFRACCRQSASTLDSPSSKERPSASAIAAMFPNDAAAICPPKMRLTVGMETPLRDAKLWNPIPSIFRRVCRRSAVIGRIFLMLFSYHIRYTFRIKPKALFCCPRIYIRNPALDQIRHAEQIANNVLRKSLYILTLMRSDAPIWMDLKSRVHPTAQHARPQRHHLRLRASHETFPRDQTGRRHTRRMRHQTHHVESQVYAAQSLHINTADSNTVFTASSCKSGGYP